jgi:hypothetical protein
MRFRLRYLKHDLEMAPGTFVIGRSADCQLSLDDPLVSRRHALLLVGEDAVFVEDAGSRNGVIVNGNKIPGRTKLADGDRITIGTQDMVISAIAQPEPTRKPWMNTPNQGPPTLVTMPIAARSDPPLKPSGLSSPPEESTFERPRRGEALRLLGGVADKALALGNPEGAERLLQNGLAEILGDAKNGREVTPEAMELAARFAARLASGTGKGSWGDYVVELHRARAALPPSTIVDELYVAARKMKGFDLSGLRGWLEELRARAGSLTPNERFVLQRLEGLEKLIAAR